MADVVDDIKARLGIEELVGQYVQLKKAGRNFKGLCPFHSEKTPSFVVSPEKQICHCFGCNKGGDIFAFIEEVEGVSFPEALQILGEKVGIKVDEKKIKKGAEKSDKDIYFKVHDLACEFFEKELYKSNDGKKVLDYLYKRGLNEDTIKEFRIGFAPDSYDALYPYLLDKGIPKDILIKSGLVSAKNLAADGVYDKYRARLIFPIFDYFGRVCGFGGRALKKDQSPKYLNSPENKVYNKSKILFGLSHAKKYIKEKDSVLLVEGYFDVIVPYQSGVKNVVATSGTALSDEQAKLIKRLTLSAVTCFDNDSAGFEATKRAYSILHKQGINMRTVDTLDQKDPADFVLEHGVEFEKLIDGARDFVSFFIDKLIKENDVMTIEGRRSVFSAIVPLYSGMSPANRDFFVRELATKLSIKEQFLYEEIENMKLPSDHPARIGGDEVVINKAAKILLDDMVLSLLLEFPKLFKFVADALTDQDLNDEAKSVYNALTDQYNSARGELERWDFDKGILPSVSDKIQFLRLYAEEVYTNLSEQSLEIELVKLVDRMKKDRGAEELKDLQRRIAEAEKSENKEEIRKLLEEQQSLIKIYYG